MGVRLSLSFEGCGDVIGERDRLLRADMEVRLSFKKRTRPDNPYIHKPMTTHPTSTL